MSDPRAILGLVRRAGLVAAVAALLAVGALVVPAPGLASDCRGAGSNHAAVVVEHGDGRLVTACVAFGTSTIGGAELLKLSGLEYATSAYGGLGQAVCQVDGEPATYPAGCWTSSSPYWVVFVARGGGPWASAMLGISSLSFTNGDAIGFHYQSQTVNAEAPPVAGRCPAPVATALPTSAPTPRPTATPRVTPAATAGVRSATASTGSGGSGGTAASGLVTPEPTPSSTASPTDGGAAGVGVAGATGGPGDAAPSQVLTTPQSAAAASDPPSGAAALDPAAATAWLGAAVAVGALAIFGASAARRRGRP